jgi:hypothetical protein
MTISANPVVADNSVDKVDLVDSAGKASLVVADVAEARTAAPKANAATIQRNLGDLTIS